MKSILVTVGLAILVLTISGCNAPENSASFNGPPTNDRIDLSRYDMNSEIRDAGGSLVTKVTVKNGRLDFSRAPGQSRGDFLKTLRAAGVREIHSSIVGTLGVTSNGQPALPILGNFQTLKEKDDGFDLVIAEGSQILDTNGNVLATITSGSGGPALTFAPGQSLKTLDAVGVRFFYYKLEPTNDKLHEVEIVKAQDGGLRLK
jgi:hypothetical protein